MTEQQEAELNRPQVTRLEMLEHMRKTRLEAQLFLEADIEHSMRVIKAVEGSPQVGQYIYELNKGVKKNLIEAQRHRDAIVIFDDMILEEKNLKERTWTLEGALQEENEKAPAKKPKAKK